ncbi:Coiled-coil domain-containing protein 77 [Monoraphidium neglectum]|uniref:Coiled-coil domain-containing protein 77 n=1 Tax=Monoraphidium neglectum TaxID=145388 RepID=A0A0D2LKL9_9CHLO|nr:Coiled-coil domain-containing protein 77 [Monoraphidium neglectum]KIZ06949.1 Coiled-coil domain-containing protein 77 [Monoraphidium neglectum]|eukprot:XP_013905968.1 Coiled-coil domain-containing protein 77 [Monoraphidium neglectum]
MAQTPAKRIEEVLPSPQLLAHYKTRIEEFEAERDELLRAVARCAVQSEDLHRLEWENRKRADEVRELQQALSDAQQFLFEERQRLLALQAENDELKLQELDDRKRMQHLLAMTQPLEQQITYRGDGLPAASTLPAAGAAGAGQQPGQAGGGGGNVMRTVFLPTANADALLLKIESLQAQLNEQRALSEERVEALLVDRKVRQQEEERHRANFLVQIEALSTKVTQLEDTLRQTTKDYIEARRARQDAEARAAAAEAQMHREVDAARADSVRERRAAKQEARDAAAVAEARMREYVDRFREQVRAREEELTNLASLHASTKAAADKRIADLEARASRLQDSNRQLEQRRQLEVDGWGADVTLLRKQLAAVDRKLTQMRLIDRLEDDERLDTLLDQLQKKAPSVPAAAAGKDARGRRPRRHGDDGGSSQAGGEGDAGDDDASATMSSGIHSVKSQLAAEMRAVRRQLDELDARAGAKAERAGVAPRAANYGRLARGFGT